jgi:hypothetical protein
MRHVRRKSVGGGIWHARPRIARAQVAGRFDPTARQARLHGVTQAVQARRYPLSEALDAVISVLWPTLP